MNKTPIEWTDDTWNPTRGCSLVSPGCTNCYAMRQAHRFSGKDQPYEGLTRMTSNGPVWTGEVRLAEDKLEEPLHWKKPRRIFVNSMSDLFHESLPDEAIDKVFAVIALCPQHIFQVLTKRAKRMYEYFADEDELRMRWGAAAGCMLDGNWIWGKGRRFRPQIEKMISASLGVDTDQDGDELEVPLLEMPLANCHLGVSVENQATFEDRWRWLRQIPAALRWLSYEPALGALDAREALIENHYSCDEGTNEAPTPTHRCWPTVDWIVCGGESGPDARPFDIQWARDVIAQCKAAGTKCFFKQAGSNPVLDGKPLHLLDRKGGNLAELPEDIGVREYPA